MDFRQNYTVIINKNIVYLVISIILCRTNKINNIKEVTTIL
jgi:hypothetical protein